MRWPGRWVGRWWECGALGWCGLNIAWALIPVSSLERRCGTLRNVHRSGVRNRGGDQAVDGAWVANERSSWTAARMAKRTLHSDQARVSFQVAKKKVKTIMAVAA